MISRSASLNAERYAPTLEALQRSRFRSRFQLSDRDRQYIDAKGPETIHRHAFDFVQTRIAAAFPANDGKQTPFKGHPVFVAQHATATCCRGCIEKWHRIQKGTALTDSEIDFIVGLVMAWIDRQLHLRNADSFDCGSRIADCGLGKKSLAGRVDLTEAGESPKHQK